MPSFVFPETLVWEEHTDRYGRLVVEPLERGYATTLGNSLRRVLLSSIPGAAIVRVNFAGNYHEYDTIPGVREDLLSIILNLRGVVFRTQDEELHRLYLSATGPCEVRAKDLEVPAGVEVVNPDHYIASLNEEGKLEVEIELEVGRGFRPAEENKREDAPLSLIPIDSDFSHREGELPGGGDPGRGEVRLRAVGVGGVDQWGHLPPGGGGPSGGAPPAAPGLRGRGRPGGGGGGARRGGSARGAAPAPGRAGVRGPGL